MSSISEALYSSTRGKHGKFHNPFLDIASTYMPETAKELIQVARVFYYTNPLVKTIAHKFAEYGITQIVYDHKSQNVCDAWQRVMETTLDVLDYSIHAGLNYFALGNHIMSIRFPTRRKFICKNCSHEAWEENVNWDYSFPNFYMECKSCNGGHTNIKSYQHCDAVDVVVHDVRRISFISWNPDDIFINWSQEMPEKSKYFFKVPKATAGKIRRGYKHQISAIPVVYIEAVRRRRLIEICKDNLYHMKRRGLADPDMAWGKPEPIAAFKKIFYAATLNKSQEAIALDRANPLDIIAPAAGNGVNPVKLIGMQTFEDNVRTQIKLHQKDIAYKAIMSNPVYTQRLGGDAKALLLTGELDQANRDTAAAMDTPVDVVYGNLNWSGASVTLRMLENKFMNFRKHIIKMINWSIERLSTYVGLPKVAIKLSKFKMADDPQQKQLALQLYSMGLLSAKTILSEWGWDWKKEAEQRAEEEAIRSVFREQVMETDTNIEGRRMLIAARYQGQAEQLTMSSARDAEQKQILESAKIRVEHLMRKNGDRKPNIDDLVQQLAHLVKDQSSSNAPMVLDAIRRRNSSLATLVEMRLADDMVQVGEPGMMGAPMMGGGANPFDPAMAQLNAGGGPQMGAPMPEQLPPRRISS